MNQEHQRQQLPPIRAPSPPPPPQQQQQQQQQQQPLQYQQHNQPFDNFLQNDQYIIGDNLQISSASYRDAINADLPSKFVTIMSHAIWGYEILATRVVRKQSNAPGRSILTPRKKELLAYHYEKFLKKRNYSREKIDNELKKMNTYLGRSITAAKRKLIQ